MDIVDRIKFDAPSDDLLVWKYPSEQIRLGSQLIVNQSQESIIFKGGQALDIFGPGRHTLKTGNIPLLRKLVNMPFDDKTPFTAEIWFINKTVKRDMTWGTQSPIPVIDSTYEYPISVRAFGKWGFRIDDSRSFMTQIVGTLVSADAAKVDKYFIGEITQRFSDVLTKYFTVKKISIFEINAFLNELSSFTEEDIKQEFGRFGIEVINFNVERISIPQEEKEKIQEVLGKKMEIEQISKAKVGQAYITMRTFDTLEKVAENEGGATGGLLAGGLGLGMGLGAGIPVGKQVGSVLNMETEQNANKVDDEVEKMKKLKRMLEEGLITKEEYNKKRKQILEDI